MPKKLPPAIAAKLAKRRGSASLRRMAAAMQAPIGKRLGCDHCRAQFACVAVGYCKLDRARDLVRERSTAVDRGST